MTCRAAGGILAAFVFWGCASIPRGAYGVDELMIEGAHQLAEGAIRRCLLTVERNRFQITLGFASSDCQAPAFDTFPPALELWTWPWSEWGELNPAVVDVDRARVERFYRARGFYDARVVDVRYEPERAEDPSLELAPGQCDPDQDACAASITFVVEEGSPIAVGRVEIEGLAGLPAAVQAEVRGSADLPSTGQRFDELDFDRGESSLAERLAEASYAAAQVRGVARLDHAAKLAHINYQVEPGPAYSFGQVHVRGHRELPTGPIVGAASIGRGRPYRQSALDEVQREVYALGAFSAVQIDRVLDHHAHEVDLKVTVRPLEYDAFRLGVGIMAGALQRTKGAHVDSVPQWDIHLLGSYERRHIVGTLGKLRIEDRPRLIWKAPFPEIGDDQLGNVLRVRLSEPGLIEARTELVAEALWDYGPDPFEGFLRSDVALRLSAQRGFLRRHLFARLALEHDRYLVPSTERRDPEQAAEISSNYTYSFAEQNLRVDLRDDQVRPRRGALLLLNTSQSVLSVLSDWTLVRLVPDARAYLPLPFGMTFALRFALGALFIIDAARSLDPDSTRLGPQAYRLRGGGAQSNRGFVAGELGGDEDGGIRRWEASLELRMRLGEQFGFTLFFDMGNVSQQRAFGLDVPNPAVGCGLRYSTLVGTLRGDVGFRLAGQGRSTQLLLGQPGAVHLTIGEAF